MIINYSDANDTTKLHLRHIWEESKYNIVIINIKRLQFNLLKHKYVPPHFILSNADKEKIIEKYNIKNDNIPEISRFDPVAQVMCMKPNEICKIIRPSKNAIESEYFRICKNK